MNKKYENTKYFVASEFNEPIYARVYVAIVVIGSIVVRFRLTYRLKFFSDVA